MTRNLLSLKCISPLASYQSSYTLLTPGRNLFLSLKFSNYFWKHFFLLPPILRHQLSLFNMFMYLQGYVEKNCLYVVSSAFFNRTFWGKGVLKSWLSGCNRCREKNANFTINSSNTVLTLHYSEMFMIGSIFANKAFINTAKSKQLLVWKYVYLP